MKKTNLLIKEPPLVVLPSLAQEIGLSEAIIVQQLHYWLENPKAGIERNGEKWIFNTYEEWQENFPFWSVYQIQRIFLNLEKMGIVIAEQLDAKDRDMRKYYRLNYEKLCMMDSSKSAPSNIANLHDVNRNTETTSETTKDRDIQEPVAKKLSDERFTFNPNIGTMIQIWKDDFKDDIIIRAIDQAVTRNARSLSYVDKILIGWKANGIPPTRPEQIAAVKKYPQSPVKPKARVME